MYFIELFGHLASYFDWYLSDYYLWQFFGINMIPKDCFIGFKMGQYCYFQTKISWNKVYLKLRNWFVFLLCSLHLTSVWCIFWMSYPMMSMDWLIENSAHRTTIRRDKSPTLPKSNMINKDKKNTKTKTIVLHQYLQYYYLITNEYINKGLLIEYLQKYHVRLQNQHHGYP